MDATALCYAVSDGIKLFGEPGLPEFDKIYIVSFTDGLDNVSGGLYGDVPQALVFERANENLVDLGKNTSLISYAIGLGNAPRADDMKRLVVGIDPSEGYREAKSTDSNLGQVFTDVANSLLATARDVYLVTNNSTYTDEYPKFFRLNVQAKQTTYTYHDIVIGKLGERNMFSVVKYGDYLTFDEPIQIIPAGNKMLIPLKNLKFTVNGASAVVDHPIDVLVSLKPASSLGYPLLEDFHSDVEDGPPTIQNIEKKIAVVLVLDCSSSMTTSTFNLMKTAANDFIKILAEVK
ncbi:hypothetical protein AGMMS49965_25550 [Bacteroidia bacterium]|nr:hypothetical protein AGMMS49965_25550 [Bacteroidia bacterium]